MHEEFGAEVTLGPVTIKNALFHGSNRAAPVILENQMIKTVNSLFSTNRQSWVKFLMTGSILIYKLKLHLKWRHPAKFKEILKSCTTHVW